MKKGIERINNKRERGITLIALILIIIILLILAGITILMLTGENGILNKAAEAREQTIIANEKEIITLAYLASKAENYTENVSSESLQIEIDKMQNNVEVSSSGDNITVWFKDTDHRYTISSTGTIEKIEDSIENEKNVIQAVYIKPIELVELKDGTVGFLSNASSNWGLTKLNLNDIEVITKSGIKQTFYNGFIDKDGKVYTCGDNYYGQLGNGTTEDSNTPICISDISGNALNGKKICNVYTGKVLNRKIFSNSPR